MFTLPVHPRGRDMGKPLINNLWFHRGELRGKGFEARLGHGLSST